MPPPVPAMQRAAPVRRPPPVSPFRAANSPAIDMAPPVPARERSRRATSAPPGPPVPQPTQVAEPLVPERRMPRGVALSSVPRRLAATLLELGLFVVTLGLGWFLWALLAADDGQTPARQVLGMRVISARDGVPLGLAGMLVGRGLFGSLIHALAILCTGSVLAFMPLWDVRNRTVCDRISKSLVVNDRYGLLL